MDALVHMLVHLWTRPQQNAATAWLPVIAPVLPSLLTILISLLLFRKKTPPGGPRNTAVLGLLILLGTNTLMAVLGVLMAYSARVTQWMQNDFFFILWPGRFVLELVGHGLLFRVLLRLRKQGKAHGSSMAALALLLGAAALRIGPILMPPYWGHNFYDFVQNALLWWFAPALLWLAGFALLVRSLIAVLHTGT